MVAKKTKIEVDVLNYFLTPKMKIAGEKKKKEVIEKYGEKNLAKILLSDPAVQALKANVGDVIEIEREGPSGKYMYYRIVVPGE
ncbi:MAG: DNA-directed RNA polymerase subunit RpoH/Rpb5 C-terminal domain-containing protein [Candidatus Anstonellales archaeon]